MAPKKQAARPVTPNPTTTSTSSPTVTKRQQQQSNPATMVYERYLSDTPSRTKLIDAFLVFLVVVGVLQFVYCVVAGNYPFNAFLAGFSATVGQFVLAVSLRMQTNKENAKEFETISPERAFADFVFGSLLLHFFCVHFIN